MTTLVVGEVAGGTLSRATRSAIAAAKSIGEPVDAILAGGDIASAAAELAACDGVATVFCASADHLSYPLAEDVAPIVTQLVKEGGYAQVLIGATVVGKDLMPRVAVMLDVQPLTEVIEFLSPRQAKRPVYAGNLIATVTSSDSVLVATVRATAFDPVGDGDAGTVKEISAGETSGQSVFVNSEAVERDRPDLTAADVVISGGRGMQNADNFKILESVADKLGAAVGASRAAVDSGFAPNDLQVGQTGKVVAPKLYIAVGISGAIQHLAGMKDSKVIVAINKDPDAPIFQVADYGLVADLFEAVPEFESKL